MSDPDPSDGYPIESPITRSPKLEPATVSDDKKIIKELKKILKNRSVILTEPFSQPSAVQGCLTTNNKSLRTKIKNFLPIAVYKMVSRLKPIHQQKKLGTMIALVLQKNQDAWQRLGECRAEGADDRELRKLQLDCEQSQLWLDLLEGRGQSNVTADRARIVDCLKACVAAEASDEFQQADEAYLEANHHLKLSIIHENDLKIELQTPKASSPMASELKQFEKMLVDEASALEAYRLYGQSQQL
ncbi:hypothetical protein [Endozoicomonas sp.]|uniref:hypothetical protein n=1 Tax=Endozoicomonas sp. TaxID=1892382 RepID=UPI00288767C9|nr:hypothetical protein [Endozoicomonas sp.]